MSVSLTDPAHATKTWLPLSLSYGRYSANKFAPTGRLVFPSSLYSNVEKDSKIAALLLCEISFVADGENLYIGTLNFDQSSAVLDTEIALFSRSRELAVQVERAIRKDTSPETAGSC